MCIEIHTKENRDSHLVDGRAARRPRRSSSTAAGKTDDRAPAGAWPRRFASRRRHIQKPEDFGPIAR
jgi:hypothetical protein